MSSTAIQRGLERARTAGYVVRPARVEDADRIGAIHVQAWRESYWDLVHAGALAALDPVARAQRWRQWLQLPVSPVRLLVGVHPDGRIVGMIVVGPCRDIDNPTPDEVWAINLLAECKGSGLADLMLTTALEGGPASMWVLRDNPRARDFLVRHGFHFDGSEQYDPGLETVEVRMLRR